MGYRRTDRQTDKQTWNVIEALNVRNTLAVRPGMRLFRCLFTSDVCQRHIQTQTETKTDTDTETERETERETE
jgi:hypothetical protein